MSRYSGSSILKYIISSELHPHQVCNHSYRSIIYKLQLHSLKPCYYINLRAICNTNKKTLFLMIYPSTKIRSMSTANITLSTEATNISTLTSTLSIKVVLDNKIQTTSDF